MLSVCRRRLSESGITFRLSFVLNKDILSSPLPFYTVISIYNFFVKWAGISQLKKSTCVGDTEVHRAGRTGCYRSQEGCRGDESCAESRQWYDERRTPSGFRGTFLLYWFVCLLSMFVSQPVNRASKPASQSVAINFNHYITSYTSVSFTFSPHFACRITTAIITSFTVFQRLCIPIGSHGAIQMLCYYYYYYYYY